MKMMRRSALGLVLLLLAAGTVAAQQESFVTVVQDGDPDVNMALRGELLRVAFADVDGDGQLDLQDPDEPAYIDRDSSGTVSFGDLRLTGFLTYPAGTAVNYTNRDLGLTIQETRGWFAQSDEGAWWLDVDGSEDVSQGDLRLGGNASGTKASSTDEANGRSLDPVHTDTTPSERFGWADSDGDGRLGWDEPVYLDVNTDDQASAGELRFEATRLGIDDQPTGREFQQAVDELLANDEVVRQDAEDGDADLDRRIDRVQARIGQLQADLEERDRWLTVLGVVDLVGVLGLGIWLYVRSDRPPTGDDEAF